MPGEEEGTEPRGLEVPEVPDFFRRGSLIGYAANSGFEVSDVEVRIPLREHIGHISIEGPSGEGKTHDARVIAESAVMDEGLNVIVVDSTLEWTGFFERNRERADFHRFKMTDYRFDGHVFEGGFDIRAALEKDVAVFIPNTGEEANLFFKQVFDHFSKEQSKENRLLLVVEEAARYQSLKYFKLCMQQIRKFGVLMMPILQYVVELGTKAGGQVRSTLTTPISAQYHSRFMKLRDKEFADMLLNSPEHYVFLTSRFLKGRVLPIRVRPTYSVIGRIDYEPYLAEVVHRHAKFDARALNSNHISGEALGLLRLIKRKFEGYVPSENTLIGEYGRSVRKTREMIEKLVEGGYLATSERRRGSPAWIRLTEKGEGLLQSSPEL
jgi:hypothetical protein